MEQMQKLKIAVVGGGAAGLIAAAQAASTLREKANAAEVAVLEGAPRVGRKLLATGNGRCNLTNTNAGAAFYHGDFQRAQPVFSRYSPAAVMETFAGMGLLCRVEDEGRVYPYGGQASAVLDTLRLRLQSLDVREICGAPVSEIQKDAHGFVLKTGDGQLFEAQRVILAAGGKASPQLGSDGGGYALAKMLGHSVTPLFPALVQVKTPAERVRAVKGMRSNCAATLLADGVPVKSETGEVQFTDSGLSGICIFQLSRFVGEFYATGKLNGRPCRRLEISLDLLPEYSLADVRGEVESRAALYPELPAGDLLFGLLNKRVGQELVKTALPQQRALPAKSLTRAQIELLAQTMKHFTFPAQGVLSWKNAQVTAGGVPLGEVLTPSMESQLCGGLYIAGEMLDLDGCCGGFNLHWAWISGLCAGEAAARSLLGE